MSLKKKKKTTFKFHTPHHINLVMRITKTTIWKKKPKEAQPIHYKSGGIKGL